MLKQKCNMSVVPGFARCTLLLQVLPIGTTTSNSSRLVALNPPIHLTKPFPQRPPTHNLSSSSSQPVEAGATDANSAELSSAPHISSGAVNAESSPQHSEALDASLHDAAVPAGPFDTANEHVVHRQTLWTNRLLHNDQPYSAKTKLSKAAGAVGDANVSSSDTLEGPFRLKPSEKLKGMIASSSRALVKPGK